MSYMAPNGQSGQNASVTPESNCHEQSKQKESLKIAFFTFSYAPFMTGIATGAHSRVKSLLELGHQVRLIHPAADDQYSKEIQTRPMQGLEVFARNPRFSSVTYPTKPHPLFRCHPEPRSFRYWNDGEQLRGFDPDVILVDEAAGMYGFSSIMIGGYRRPIGVRYARQKGIPAISLYETDWVSYATHYLGTWTFAFLRPLLALQSRRFTNNYDSTFFPSETQRLRHAGGWVRKQTYVPFHGVDCSSFHPDKRQHSPIPDDGRPTILFVGRMAIEKSIAELFSVAEVVRKQIPNIHLIIVGGGPQASKISKLAALKSDYCTYLGESFGDQLRGLYARADVYANPSATENFCTTNLESLASGTPIVAANAGGNCEQIVEGSNGFLVTPHQPSEMATRVIQILESSEMRGRMSIAGRKFALNFDELACGRHLECAIRSVIDQKKNIS